MDATVVTAANNDDEERLAYKDSTYEIVSRVAYLIGVPLRIFENEHEPPDLAIYKKMDTSTPARIIRNLCIVRTAIERNFKHINDKMRTDYKSIFSMPEYVPEESLLQLAEDGVRFAPHRNAPLGSYVTEINKLISNRINNCRELFPIWLNWQYIHDLFIMPNGFTDVGAKEAAAVYYANMACYPYQVYINWNPVDEGNILYNDKKFVTLLYRWHGDAFTEYSKVADAGSYIKGNIYDFIRDAGKVVLVVDCENSDPYRLAATMKRLDEFYIQKISSIILFDDIHTASAWGILEQYTNIPVEHILVERVKSNKSLVDIMLTARACKEFYEKNVDSFVIVSSDSDYWGLISSLPQARFLMMIEHEKCGPDIKEALINSGIFYAYIDDFYSGDSEDIKMSALFQEMNRYIEDSVQLNLHEMFDEALRATRVDMMPSEKKQFFEKYIKPIRMEIDAEGNVALKLKKWA